MQPSNTFQLKQNSELYEERREGIISPALQISEQSS